MADEATREDPDPARETQATIPFRTPSQSCAAGELPTRQSRPHPMSLILSLVGVTVEPPNHLGCVWLDGPGGMEQGRHIFYTVWMGVTWGRGEPRGFFGGSAVQPKRTDGSAPPLSRP